MHVFSSLRTRLHMKFPIKCLTRLWTTQLLQFIHKPDFDVVLHWTEMMLMRAKYIQFTKAFTGGAFFIKNLTYPKTDAD